MQRQNDISIQAILAELELPALRVIADQDEVAAIEAHLNGKYTFSKALKLALEAFLTNPSGSPAQGHDSAFDVVRGAPDAFGLSTAPSDAEISEALRNVLASDPRAEVVLLTATTIAQPAYRFLPEYGETIDTNWIFRIIAPANWPLLQWSIVAVDGEIPAYSYSFD